MHSPRMCYDPVRNYMLLVGAPTSNTAVPSWSYDGVAWTQRTSPPAAGPVAVDGQSGQLLLTTTQGTYAWDGTTWQLAGGGINAGNESPEAMAYDWSRHDLITVTGSSSGMSTWRWTGSTWIRITVTSNAAVYPRRGPLSLAYDPASQRLLLAVSSTMYILAGSAWVEVPTTRWYEWNGFGWNQRLPTTAPAVAGPMATDTQRRRIVMFDADSYYYGPNGQLPNHTWTIANGVLSRLTTPIEPSLRYDAAMAFDPLRGVCVLFGGANGGGQLADTWEFDLGPLASFTAYGTGCPGSRGVPSIAAQGASLPRIGAAFTANVNNLPWTGPVFLILGLSNTSYGGTPLPIDLGFLGAPGCLLLASNDSVQPLVNVLGSATWSWSIPPFPGASFYTQVLPLDPGVNALGLTVSNGGHGVVGL